MDMMAAFKYVKSYYKGEMICLLWTVQSLHSYYSLIPLPCFMKAV